MAVPNLHLVLVVFSILASSSVHGYRMDDGKCERITIPMCMDMRYNMTKMPNLLGQTDQKDATIRINEFIPLVQIGCSKLLKFFLCSLYAPMCTEQVDETLIIPPCRSMCLDVKASCEPVLIRFSFPWPDVLDCNNLPQQPDRSSLCMEAPSTTEEPPHNGNPFPGTFTQNTDWIKLLEALNGPGTTRNTDPTPISRNTCSDRYVHVDKLQPNTTCAPRCGVDALFRTKDKQFAEIWMLVWAAICFASTLLTVLTFLLDTSRFRYPERPIIFLSLCYAIYSVAYIMRAIIGPKAISCDVGTSEGRDVEFLIHEGLESTWCIIIFLILYFFGMASCIWWVILTLTWFLAAGRKWGQEAIESMGSYFHLAAWAIPAIKTIVILTMRRVDGDELTGLCYVGHMDKAAQTGFVVAPLAAYLILGTLFLLSGFLALCRIRKNLKHEGTNIRKLEKLMAKIGIFSVLYTVPATCVIGCYFYEQTNLQQWKYESMSTECKIIRYGPQTGQKDCTLDRSIPTIEIYMLKIFMSLVVGISSSMWIWSSKTVSTWTNFFTRTLGRRKSNVPVFPGHSGAAVNQNQRKQIQYQKCAIPAPSMSKV